MLISLPDDFGVPVANPLHNGDLEAVLEAIRELTGLRLDVDLRVQ